MKESPRKVIKLNQMRPSILNRTQMSAQKDVLNPVARIPYSMSTKYNREPSISFSTQKTETGSSKNQALQIRNFQNRTAESKHHKKLIFELKCEDIRCDDDSNTLASNGGYSFKSLDKKNAGSHNHRKINQLTEYVYAEDQIPQVPEEFWNRNLQEEPERDDLQQKKFPYPKVGKVNWKLSPFAPMFCNKNPQLQPVNMQRTIENEEARQKKELQKYELSREIEFEKKKIRDAKRKVLKTDTKLEYKGKGFGLGGVLESTGKNMKTRLQQKQEALSGFEVSRRAEPGNQGKHCYPCKIKFEDYWEHIQHPDHKLKSRMSFGAGLFQEEIQKRQEMYKEEMSSEEYRYFMELDKYLERVVESLEVMLTKKNVILNQKLKEVKNEVDDWANY